MTRIRCYISKAFNSHPHALAFVLDDLEAVGIEAVEYQGPNYGEKEIRIVKSCDFIIGIPPKHALDKNDLIARVTKGIYTEMMLIHNEGRICLLYDFNAKEYFTPKEYKVINPDQWKGHHGSITIEPHNTELYAVAEIIKKRKLVEKQPDSSETEEDFNPLDDETEYM